MMIHIFTIHSNITFLVAYSTVEYLSLKKEDVILLTTGYKPLAGDLRVEESFPSRYKTWFDKLKTINAPKSSDKYIASLTKGSQFIAYIDLMSYYQKILVTHPLCSSFNFIEEGNGAYTNFDDLTDLTWAERDMPYRFSSFFDRHFIKSVMRVFRGYNLRLLSIPYHYMAYTNFKDLNFFCFSNNAFYNAPPHKKVLLRPKPDDELKQMAFNLILENEVIWVDGSNGRFTGLPDEYYHRAIDKAIKILKEKEVIKHTVYVKLRKGENENLNYLVKALKESGITTQIVPDSTVLEALFLVSMKCTVIGNLSAALEYAHCFGHKSYSIYSLFDKRPQTFYDRTKGYWENVESL